MSRPGARARVHRALAVTLLVFAGCSRTPTATSSRDAALERASSTGDGHAADGPAANIPDATDTRSTWGARSADEHRVVFADRSSQAYLLLPPDAEGGAPPRVPTRESLNRLIETRMQPHLDTPEVQLLQTLVRTEIATETLDDQFDALAIDPEDPAAMRRAAKNSDLMGLHIAAFETDKVAPRAVLADPILSRHLSETDRAALLKRDRGVLLRVDYRARRAFRGLRLLQTLVRLYAASTDALILDPDTLETFDVDAFSNNRLRSSTANVASQIAVVPFPETSRGGTPTVRLSTRGMRRFGCVDLELTGLPADPQTLQLATDFILGVAHVLVTTSEVDRTGVALELEPEITIHWRDIEQAYRESDRSLPPRCSGCPETAVVHLVERPAMPTDPVEHVVAQIVAPRVISDPATYDHPRWVASALARIFGS